MSELTCFIVPNMTTKLMRGELPEIVEVPCDPTRGWLDPEFSSKLDALWSMYWYLDGLVSLYERCPFRTQQVLLLDTLYDLAGREQGDEGLF